MKIYITNPRGFEEVKIVVTNRNIRVGNKKIKVDENLKVKVVDEIKKLKPDMLKFTKLQFDKKWQEEMRDKWLIGAPVISVYGRFGIFTFVGFYANYRNDDIRQFEIKINDILYELKQYM